MAGQIALIVLLQAESVAQLIEARTVAAADSALAGLAGGLGREVQEMRAECIDLLTEMDVRWVWCKKVRCGRSY